ncbi:MAG: hypothetical protein FJW40_24775 [Acidobacteria bacterium]|nr:hypothetical protein [Acidobacteriota bacterium]
MKSGGRVEVEGFNGSVEITGWDREEVEVSGTKYASSEDRLKEIKVDVAGGGDSLRIVTTRPANRRGGAGVKFILRVPRKVTLERISSSNGPMRVEGIEGSARLKTSNGSLRLAALTGDVDATTSNGGIEATQLKGNAVFSTSNGGVRAEVSGYVEANTSNGPIRVRLMEPGSSRPLRFTTSNGPVELTLEKLKGNDIRAESSNGPIVVRMPASAEAQVRAHTSNSSVTSEFDVKLRGNQSKHSLEGNIGSGGPLLDLSTSNGSIKLLKL